ncbi:MAG: hypothetical protein AAF628_23600 [Planctomycetota bacterium]
MQHLTRPLVPAHGAGLALALIAGLATSALAQTPTIEIDALDSLTYDFDLAYDGAPTPSVVGMVVGYVSVEAYDGTNPWALVVANALPSMAPVSNNSADFLAQIDGTPVPGGSATVGDDWDVQVPANSFAMPGKVVGEALAPLDPWDEAGQSFSSTTLAWDGDYWTTTPASSILDWAELGDEDFDRRNLVGDLIKHRYDADTGLAMGDDTLNAVLHHINSGDAEFFLDVAAIIIQQPSGGGDPVVKISPLARLKIDLPDQPGSGQATLRFPMSAPSRYLHVGAMGVEIVVELAAPRTSTDLRFAFPRSGGVTYVTAAGSLGDHNVSCTVPMGALTGPVLVLDYDTYYPAWGVTPLDSPDGTPAGYIDFYVVGLGTGGAF